MNGFGLHAARDFQVEPGSLEQGFLPQALEYGAADRACSAGPVGPRTERRFRAGILMPAMRPQCCASRSAIRPRSAQPRHPENAGG